MDLSHLLPPKPSILAALLERRRLRAGFRGIYRKYRAYTLIHEATYVDNLELCAKFGAAPGCVVECGVWRGGMMRRHGGGARRRSRLLSVRQLRGIAAARAKTWTVRAAVAWQNRYQLADLLQQLHRRGRGSCGGNETFRRDFIFARQGMVQ